MINDIDELVSAYLDGALESDDRARVEADPALLERVEALRVVQRSIREGPVLPDTLREQLITRAIEASATAANVTSLSRRRTTAQRAARVGLAAAAAVAVFGGIAALNNRNDQNDATEVAIAADSDIAEEAFAADEASSAALAQDAGASDSVDDAASGDAEANAAEAAPIESIEALKAITFAARDDLEDVLATTNPIENGFATFDQLRSQLSPAVEIVIGCSEALTADLNGQVDGIARAVITDTSGYVGVPAETEVLIVVTGDTYLIADESTCMILTEATLFS